MKKITLLICLSSLFSFAQTIGVTPFASGFARPTELTHAGDERLFITQQAGAIKIINPDGTVNPTNFLTLPSSVVLSSGNEQGLLGLAFHPNYAQNGFFYVNYTRTGSGNASGDTVIARYSVSASNPNVADAESATILMVIDQPYSNHNGGTLKFGPDGYLYIGMGDGGSSNDPENRAQNINTNLGKMLRIDVDGPAPYGIPSDNPYVGVDGNDEIWAIGLRNPWKFSFDSVTGNLWIADVGQSAAEEINRVSSTTAGINYGWKCYEGTIERPNCPVNGITYTMPLVSIPRSQGVCSITGGYVYRGTAYPAFVGKYFFTDICFDKIGMVSENGDVTYSDAFGSVGSVTTFGEDINGELYFVSADGGAISKIIDTSLGTDDFAKNGFSMYPNPTASEFFIRNSNAMELKRVQLFDLSGKMLLERPLQNVETNNINIGPLQDGMYLVSIENTSGEKFSSKLIVQ